MGNGDRTRGRSLRRIYAACLARLGFGLRLRLGLGLGALLVGGLGSGCGTDDVGPRSRMVGGRCTVAADCVQRCVTGNDFPGGYCTVSCTANRDCPGGSTCAASNGGVCLATCQVSADCSGYGPAYTCGRRLGQSSGAEALACVGG